MTVEATLLAAVMIPLSGLLVLALMRLCNLLYECMASLLSWPYL